MNINNNWFNETWAHLKQKEQKIHLASFVMIALGLVVTATLGAVTFAGLFSASVPLTLAVFAAGLIVDGQIYYDKFPKLLQLLIVRELFADLEAHQIISNMQNSASISADEMELYLDRWLFMRRRFKHAYYKQFPKANAVDCDRNFLHHLNAHIDRLALTTHTEEKGLLNFMIACETSRASTLTNKRSLIFKKILVSIGSFAAAVTGLGFAAIAYGKWVELLLALGVIANAALPIGWVIAGVMVAAVAGSLWALAMYKTIYTAVKDNIFSRMFDDLRVDFTGYKTWDLEKKCITVMGAGLKYIFTAILALLGLFAIVASVGAYGSAMLEWLSYVPATVIFFAGIVILPVRAIFAIEHAVGAMTEIGRGALYAYHWLRAASPAVRLNQFWHWFKQSFLPHPLQMAFIGLIGTLLFAATILHVLAEAALDMGGCTENKFWPLLLTKLHCSYDKAAQILSRIAACLKLTTQQMVVLVQSGLEFLEHFDFTFRQTPIIVSSFESALVQLPEVALKTKLGVTSKAIMATERDTTESRQSVVIHPNALLGDMIEDIDQASLKLS